MLEPQCTGVGCSKSMSSKTQQIGRYGHGTGICLPFKTLPLRRCPSHKKQSSISSLLTCGVGTLGGVRLLAAGEAGELASRPTLQTEIWQITCWNMCCLCYKSLICARSHVVSIIKISIKPGWSKRWLCHGNSLSMGTSMDLMVPVVPTGESNTFRMRRPLCPCSRMWYGIWIATTPATLALCLSRLDRRLFLGSWTSNSWNEDEISNTCKRQKNI